jgi:hypothetical protein
MVNDKMNIEEINILKKIVHFLTIVIIIWSMTPFCRRNISIIIMVAIIVLWMSFALLLQIKNIVAMKIPKYIFFLFVWLLMIFSYRFIGFSDAAWGNYFNELLFFMFVWIGDCYIKYMGEYHCQRIFLYTMIIVVVNIIHNIYLLSIYPNASVMINYSDIYNGTNVGGSTFSLFALILFCILLICFTDNTKKTRKWIYAISGVMCVLYILLAARAITVMFLVIAIGMYLYMRLTANKKPREKIIFALFLIVLIFLGSFGIGNLLKMVGSIIGNDRLTERLNAMANVLLGYDSDDNLSLTGRVELYKLSISTFLSSIKNFTIGVGYHTSTDLSLSWLFSVGIGNHSEFLDLAARYGLIGVLIIYNFFGSFISCLKKYNQLHRYFKSNIVWIIFLSYSFVNNTFDPSIGVLIFMMLPIYLKIRYIFYEGECCS